MVNPVGMSREWDSDVATRGPAAAARSSGAAGAAGAQCGPLPDRLNDKVLKGDQVAVGTAKGQVRLQRETLQNVPGIRAQQGLSCPGRTDR